MLDFSPLNCRICTIFPSCMNNTWLGPIAENQLIFLRFSSFLEYFLLFFNETIVLSDSCSFPVSWDIFFYPSMKQLSYPILEFFQFPGIFSSILQWNNCPIRFFGRFSSVYQWNIKRNFSLDVYLITLTIHRWDSFAGFTCFGFLLHRVLIFLVKQFSNFNMSDEQGAYALTVNLASDIFYHRAHRGYPY